MKNRRYCPECGSFVIYRVKRGFFKKILFKSPRLYQCVDCNHAFTSEDIAQNPKKEDPRETESEHFSPSL